MTIEGKIKKYVMKEYHLPSSEMTTITLPKLLHLVEMKNFKQYLIFKHKLRKCGWVI